MDTLDNIHVRSFFDAIRNHFPCSKDICSIIITHLLPDRPFLLEALSKLTCLAAVLAKPRSIDQRTKDWLSNIYKVSVVQERFTNEQRTLDFVTQHCDGRPLVVLDIGGYFAQTTNFLASHPRANLLGVVEDTENGAQKYERVPDLACPVISVARSPLKNPEDFLVGQSIVFSVEALLRQQGDILHGRTACVIGYGKLGRSIANLLHARHVRTVIYDIDAVQRVEAMSHGFSVASQLERALQGAGLVFCATGNVSLRQADFRLLDRGAYVATVTSSDDELELGDLHRHYRLKQVTDYITRYCDGDHHFYLMNRGQAVNFIHGAAVGPFIYLVQAELLASISKLSRGTVAPGISENDSETRKDIARIWLDHFGPQAMRNATDA